MAGAIFGAVRATPAIRLAERKGGSARLGPSSQDSQAPCTTSGAVPPRTNNDFPPKPPRMRWATYNRLEAQYDDLENRWALGIMARFARY